MEQPLGYTICGTFPRDPDFLSPQKRPLLFPSIGEFFLAIYLESLIDPQEVNDRRLWGAPDNQLPRGLSALIQSAHGSSSNFPITVQAPLPQH